MHNIRLRPNQIAPPSQGANRGGQVNALHRLSPIPATPQRNLLPNNCKMFAQVEQTAEGQRISENTNLLPPVEKLTSPTLASLNSTSPTKIISTTTYTKQTPPYIYEPVHSPERHRKNYPLLEAFQALPPYQEPPVREPNQEEVTLESPTKTVEASDDGDQASGSRDRENGGLSPILEDVSPYTKRAAKASRASNGTRYEQPSPSPALGIDGDALDEDELGHIEGDPLLPEEHMLKPLVQDEYPTESVDVKWKRDVWAERMEKSRKKTTQRPPLGPQWRLGMISPNAETRETEKILRHLQGGNSKFKICPQEKKTTIEGIKGNIEISRDAAHYLRKNQNVAVFFTADDSITVSWGRRGKATQI